MTTDVTKVFIRGLENCTDEQRAAIEDALRGHNAEVVSEEEYLKHLQDAATQEELQMQELRYKMQDTFALYNPYRDIKYVDYRAGDRGSAKRRAKDGRAFAKEVNKRRKKNKNKKTHRR